MDNRLRELLAGSFAEEADRSEVVRRCLAGEAMTPAEVEAVLAEALIRHQAGVADSARQAEERLQAEVQMDNLLALLGTILESSDEGIIALDTEDRIIRFNSSFVSIFGLSDEVMAFWHHDQVMADVLAQLTHPDAFAADLAALCADASAQRRDILECKDGRMIEWRSQAQPAVWGGVKRVVSFIDVTERFRSETTRRLLESKLDEAHSRLLEADKLAAIFQLSAGLAHEISNPIGFIRSNLETLSRYVAGAVELFELYGEAETHLPADDPMRQTIVARKEALDLEFMIEDTVALVQESLAGIVRLASMVESLRVLAHARGGEPQTTTLRALVEGALAKVDVAQGGRIKVLPVYGPQPPVACRAPELVEALTHILRNAVDAIEGEGVVGIRTGGDDAQAWVDISDNGRGIAPEHLSRVFEPFFTTKPPGAGMGLGLAVAYAILAGQGGRIEVSSEVGKGSRFRVMWPVAAAGS